MQLENVLYYFSISLLLIKLRQPAQRRVVYCPNLVQNILEVSLDLKELHFVYSYDTLPAGFEENLQQCQSDASKIRNYSYKRKSGKPSHQKEERAENNNSNNKAISPSSVFGKAKIQSIQQFSCS